MTRPETGEQNHHNHTGNYDYPSTGGFAHEGLGERNYRPMMDNASINIIMPRIQLLASQLPAFESIVPDLVSSFFSGFAVSM